MHQPRIELGAQQASVAQDGRDMGMLDFTTKPLVQAIPQLSKNINTYILVAFAVVYHYE